MRNVDNGAWVIFGAIAFFLVVLYLLSLLPNGPEGGPATMVTSACDQNRHWNCSGKVFSRGHLVPCPCECHAGVCTSCHGTGKYTA